LPFIYVDAADGCDAHGRAHLVGKPEKPRQCIGRAALAGGRGLLDNLLGLLFADVAAHSGRSLHQGTDQIFGFFIVPLPRNQESMKIHCIRNVDSAGEAFDFEAPQDFKFTEFALASHAASRCLALAKAILRERTQDSTSGVGLIPAISIWQPAAGPMSLRRFMTPPLLEP
jgi:hypothetical protein